MKLIDNYGKEWEVVRHGHPFKGEHFVVGPHKVSEAKLDFLSNEPQHLIVEPIRKKHTFGGVVFEETGEYRPPERGEWCLINDGVTLATFTQTFYHIVKPIALEGE